MGPSRSHGASTRSCRKAARNVIVLQWPCGTSAGRRSPRGDQARSGAMLVLVQVSSMKTRRAGSTSRCRAAHWARRRATSGRSCSAAISVFFITELLGVDELPDRAVVDLEAALGELSHEPAQGEVPLPAAPDQPVAMRAGDLLRLLTADLARRDAAGGGAPLQPVDRRAVADAETGRRLPTREPFLRPPPPRHAREDPSNKLDP